MSTKATTSNSEFASEIADRCGHGDGDCVVWSKGFRSWSRDMHPPLEKGGCALTACER